MNRIVLSYAAVLLTLPDVTDAVPEAKRAFTACPALADALSNPTIPEAEKFAVIERVFPRPLWSFLKTVCRNQQIGSILDIFDEYEVQLRQCRACAHAVLEYVTPLTQEQVSAMKAMVCTKTGKSEVELDLKQNTALLGGFILHIGDQTYDRSMRSTLKAMRNSLTRR